MEERVLEECWGLEGVMDVVDKAGVARDGVRVSGAQVDEDLRPRKADDEGLAERKPSFHVVSFHFVARKSASDTIAGSRLAAV